MSHRRLVPAPRLLMLAGAWLLFAIALLWVPLGTKAWRWTGWSLLVLALADGLAGLRPLILEAKRRVAGSLPLGTWSDVRLRIRNGGRVGLRLEVFDHVPPLMEFQGLPRRVAIHGRS
jgi:uncharacterized protein (DUF58 family)